MKHAAPLFPSRKRVATGRKSDAERGVLPGSDRCFSVADKVYDAVNYMGKLHTQDQSLRGVSTGYPDLDSMITGLTPGDLFVLASRPAMGKTALALGIAYGITTGHAPRPVGIFSMNDSVEQLISRILCDRAGVSMYGIRRGVVSAAAWTDILAVAVGFRDAPIYMDDTALVDIAELCVRCRRMKLRRGVEVIFIDDLPCIQPSSGNGAFSVPAVLKMLARELGIAIVVLAPLAKAAEPANSPGLDQLCEPDGIRHFADVVMLLHRDRSADCGIIGKETEGHPAELIVAKNINGPTGVVKLSFIPRYCRFDACPPG